MGAVLFSSGDHMTIIYGARAMFLVLLNLVVLIISSKRRVLSCRPRQFAVQGNSAQLDEEILICQRLQNLILRAQSSFIIRYKMHLAYLSVYLED